MSSDGLPPLPPDEDEFREFEFPSGTRSIPLGKREELPGQEHPTFNEFWASLELGDDPEVLRKRELFYEWLGQNGFDVHLRDEPTVIGTRENWLLIWNRYLKTRRLT